MLKFVRTIGGVGRKLELIKLGVSQTFELGDAVKTYTTGYADLGVAALPIIGVIDAFADSKGNILPATAVAAGTASGSNLTAVTTASPNPTYYAFVILGQDVLYSAAVSGTLGTTVSSTLRGCWIDINSAGTEYGQVLETTANRTAHAATGGMSNFYSHGLDPNDSTRLLVSIANYEMNTQIDVTP